VSKNALFHNEKESARTLARCQVSLDKSSKNYSRYENEPSQATFIAIPPVNRQVLVACFPRGGAKHAEKRRQKRRQKITPQK
jgi:hypothetical protein